MHLHGIGIVVLLLLLAILAAAARPVIIRPTVRRTLASIKL
jgi:hypothetical protein